MPKFSSAPKDPAVLSYYGLRQVVGWIGVLFPFILAIGYILILHRVQCPPALQPSISDYYHTKMRNIFEACLCIIGIFLAATWGYDWYDAWAGRIAGFAAIGVAWFPCKSPEPNIATAHFVFACVLFLTLACFCLFLFPKSDRPKNLRTSRKNLRNTVYFVCGWTILLSILCCLLCRHHWFNSLFYWYNGLFWFESTAIIPFGIAWLVKGETFLKDKGASPTRLFIRHPPTDPIPNQPA